MNKTGTGWWTNFFDDFRPVFGTIDPKVTNAEVRYLIRKLGLKPGRSFLDCPCGIGRHSLALARKGIKVTAVDLTQSYLDELAPKTRRAKLPIRTLQSDMRRLDFASQFDAAGNLGTSIGYFLKESDDLLTLKRAFRALKPGGRFAVQVTNRDWIVANFQKRDWLSLGENIILTQDRSFNFKTSILKSRWNFIKDGQGKSHDVAIRLYSFHELASLFEKAGFIEVEGRGSVKDDPISIKSITMWVFGAKPGKKLR